MLHYQPLIELDTAVKYKIPLITVVYNNNCWGTWTSTAKAIIAVRVWLTTSAATAASMPAVFFFQRVWMIRFILPGGLNVVLAPYGVERDSIFLSERMDFENCSLFHPVYQNDYSSFCLK